MCISLIDFSAVKNYKLCTQCNRLFPETAEYFHRNKATSSGLANKCKKCTAEYRKENYQRNKEKIAGHHKKYYKANKEKIAEYQKEYYQRNKEKNKKRREKNKEENAKYQKKYREANKEKLAENR